MDPRFLEMLKMVAQFGEVWRHPEEFHLLKKILLSAGYAAFEIQALSMWLVEIGATDSAAKHVSALLHQPVEDEFDASGDILQISPGANRFLIAMREVGILSETMEAHLLNKLMLDGRGHITYERIRQGVAEVVFERQFSEGESYFGIFEEEWKLLFA